MAENSSFAQEVKMANQTPSKGPDVTPEAAPPAAVADDVMNQGMPKAPEPEAPAPTPAPEPAQPAKIRIGSNEFNSMDEAIKYAQDLELAVLQQDAYQAGQKASEPKVEVPKVDPIKKRIAEKLFENPEEALEEYEKIITERVVSGIEQKAEQKANLERTWTNFYSNNQDLAGQQQIVDYILQKNFAEVKHLEANKALSIIAEKARAFISSTRQQALPSQDLPSNPVVTTGSSTGATPQAPLPKQNALDFVSQLNKMRKRES